MAKGSVPPNTASRGVQGGNRTNGKGKGKGKAPKRKENVWIKLFRRLFGKKVDEKVNATADRYVVANPMYAYDEYTGREVIRPLPSGLNDKEAMILRKVRQNAYNLDYKCLGCCGCSICGLMLGKTTVIGIIPAAGPIIDISLGVWQVNLKARKVDLPWGVSAMMYGRHAVSEGIGLVPFIGDLWIAWYKANSRNSFALERCLEKRVRERRGVEKVGEFGP